MEEREPLLSCTCTFVRDDEMLIALCGEIDLASAPSLRDLLNAARQFATTVVLDLSEVSFLDSAGIKEILDANKDLRVRIDNASPTVRRCLDLCGLTGLLLID
jgi:anti-anti-sigma factor